MLTDQALWGKAFLKALRRKRVRSAQAVIAIGVVLCEAVPYIVAMLQLLALAVRTVASSFLSFLCSR